MSPKPAGSKGFRCSGTGWLTGSKTSFIPTRVIVTQTWREPIFPCSVFTGGTEQTGIFNKGTSVVPEGRFCLNGSQRCCAGGSAALP